MDGGLARRSGRSKAAPGAAAAPAADARSARRRLAWPLVALAVLLASGVALWRARPHPVRREAGLNVLLITIDTLRADAVGAYGRSRATPWIDRLAASGVRFEQAHAHNVVTLPSHANILSGRYPLEHGVRDNAGFRFPASLDTLATLLVAHGYRTGAFVSAFAVDSQFGLSRGFEVYEDSFVNLDTASAFLMQERRGMETVEIARRWLEAEPEAPHFAWVHIFDPHFPYAPPEPYASRHPGSPYLGEVAAADAAVGSLVEPLLAAGRDGRTLVVLTADHGEALGEHGERTHGIFAYEATLRVPLILHAPRILDPGVVRAGARHVDILPTVLDALRLPIPEGLSGRSLLPAAAGRDHSTPPSYFEALSGMLTRGWAPLRGVLAGPRKYIELPLPELYDLSEDASEDRNLAEGRSESLGELRRELEALRRGDQGIARQQERGETRERLRALGYLTDSAPVAAGGHTAADDPKRLIDLDAMMHEVVGLHAAGRLDEALALCRRLVERRPQMPASWVRLAFLHRERADLGSAVGALQRALSLNPQDVDVLSLLGNYLNESGREAETVAILRAAAAGADPDVEVLIAYGVGLAQLGRYQAALTVFGRALEIDPSNAMVQVNIGTVHLMTGGHAAAREAFEAALRLNPGLGRAENSLGVIAAREGRRAEAIAHWKRAVELDPREFDTLFNLGMELRREGRLEEARPYLERFVREAPPVLYAADVAKLRALLGDLPRR